MTSPLRQPPDSPSLDRPGLDTQPGLARFGRPLSPQAPFATWPNRFAGLGDSFFTELPPQGLPDPHWVATSPGCAALLGLPADWAQRSDWQALQVLSGNAFWPGMAPLASVYSGHQFGVWAGQLGDGRALLLGEAETTAGPMEIQLKGAGRTPYSRMGDGRAVLRSSIREFLCSEAMAGLGIATTRALSLSGSALPVRRESLETAAVVARVAPSFIRFGHFQHFSHSVDDPGHPLLRQFTDFVVEQYFPDCAELPPGPARYAALLAEVSRRTALLLVDWQAVGFCHGVMNTDNLSVLGLTIDYGPFGFLDAHEPGHVCNHSDHQGRYAYARQPNVAFWNLHALAEALMPLISDEQQAQDAVDVYKTVFLQGHAQRLAAKLGLQTVQDGDDALADGLLQRMAADRADHTLTFRRLATLPSGLNPAEPPSVADDAEAVRDLFIDREAFDAWADTYRARLQQENSHDAERRLRMNRVNPKYILRNHLAEQAIRQAQAGDFSEVQQLLAVLEHPFDEQRGDTGLPDRSAYAALPPDWAQHLEVSCSS